MFTTAFGNGHWIINRSNPIQKYLQVEDLLFDKLSVLEYMKHIPIIISPGNQS